MTGKQLSKFGSSRPNLRVDRLHGPCRVLLVIEREDFAARVVELLEISKRGLYAPALVANLAKANIARSEHRPDVLLVDISSPNLFAADPLEGLDALAEDLPVVVIAGARADDLVDEAVRLGVQDYIYEDELSVESLDRALRHARERHRLLRLHQRTEARFRRIVSESPDGALVTDMRGVLLYANPTALDMFPAVLNPGDPVAKIGIQIPGSAQDNIATDDGRTVEVKCRRIEWENRPAWLVQLRDASAPAQIADLRARLAQSEKLAGIGQLAAGVAHEINNPLAFILANLSATLGHVHHVQDILSNIREAARGEAQESLPTVREQLERIGPEFLSEMREMLEDNLDGVDRINTIVRELRTFSRQGGNEEHELMRVHELVKSACHMVSSQIRHRAALVKVLQPVKPVMGHRVKLVQILTNLLMNAAQALPDHRGREERIEVRTRQSDRWVIISVLDTGTGVPDDVRDRIFEPFFTTKRRDVGTGIGLSLSAELARQHDGELVLVETSPKGSTFELRLPAVESVRLVRPAPTAVETVTAANEASSCRVLLVDDEPNVRKSMIRTLRAYQVETASSGREALSVLENGRFDAVICDLVMPDLDGVDVHEAIISKRPELADKVIYTSGGAYTPRTAAFVAKNDIMFLEKPIHPQQLLSLLERVLAGA